MRSKASVTVHLSPSMRRKVARYARTYSLSVPQVVRELLMFTLEVLEVEEERRGGSWDLDVVVSESRDASLPPVPP